MQVIRISCARLRLSGRFGVNLFLRLNPVVKRDPVFRTVALPDFLCTFADFVLSVVGHREPPLR